MDNRKKILEQALRLFAERGYDAVGVQEIVESSGVTKPTLYHYFGNKEGLLEELLREHFTDLTGHLKEAATYAGDLPLCLTRVVQCCFHYAREHPHFYRLQLALWFAPPESAAFRVVVPLLKELQAILEEMFTRAVVNHGNMKGRHAPYAATFLGTINTYIGMHLNGFVKLTDPLVHQVVRQFSHGIYS